MCFLPNLRTNSSKSIFLVFDLSKASLQDCAAARKSLNACEECQVNMRNKAKKLLSQIATLHPNVDIAAASLYTLEKARYSS